jgi:putative two-component system response regulator
LLNAVLQNSRILIIEDQQENITLLQKLLVRAGFANHRSVTESCEAITAFREYCPDLVFLDLHMPCPDGFEILRQLHSLIPQQTYLPIVVLTAELSQPAKQKALCLGAKDFITRPFDNIEIILRINTLLGTRLLNRELEQQNQILDERVRERTLDLENAQVEILHRLALVAEHRDDTTGAHTLRVGELAALLGRSIRLPEPQVQLIRMAAPLHDLGKIGIRDKILLKPAKLTAEEYELVKTHTIIGARILSGSKFPILQLAEKIALYHHERWDGTGYCGLQSEEIPVEARIVAIADAYDVLTHRRPYKEAWSAPAAIAEIRSQSGRQFDPQLVSKFTELLRRDVESGCGTPTPCVIPDLRIAILPDEHYPHAELGRAAPSVGTL